MKKTLITAVAVLATLSLYGQGSVVFSNLGGQAVRNELTGANVIIGSTFKVGLYYDNAGTFTLVGAAANFGPTPGFFSGGNRTVPAGMITPGAIGQFQVRGWQSAFGIDYDAVVANPAAAGQGLAGASATFTVDTGDPTTTPAGAPAPISALMPAFTLTVVPEPSVIGLGLLGAVSLLVLRRRK